MTMDMSDEDKKTLNQAGEMEMEGEPAVDPSWMEGAEAPKQKDDAVSPTWLEGHEPPAAKDDTVKVNDEAFDVGFDKHFSGPKEEKPMTDQEKRARWENEARNRKG